MATRLLSVLTSDILSLSLSDGGNSPSAPVDANALPIVIGARITFVFRPGGVAAGNVYTDWATMMTDVVAQQGPKWIEVDGSIQTAVVPAGTWNVNDVTFTGAGPVGSLANVLRFADGAHFTFSHLQLVGAVRFSSDALSPVWQSVGAAVLSIHDFAGIFTANVAAAPWGQISSTTQVLVADSGLMGQGTVPVLTVDAARFLILTLVSAASMAANSVVGAGTMLLQLAPDGIFNATQTVAVVTTTFVGLAKQLAYTPAVAGNWRPAPTLTNAALDQLAAPNAFSEVNAAPLGAAATNTYTSVATLTKARSGKVRVTGSYSVSGASVNTSITLQLYRDVVGTLLPPLARGGVQLVPAAGGSLFVEWIDTLPDTAAHAWGVLATAALGTIAAGAGDVAITANEL